MLIRMWTNLMPFFIHVLQQVRRFPIFQESPGHKKASFDVVFVQGFPDSAQSFPQLISGKDQTDLLFMFIPTDYCAVGIN